MGAERKDDSGAWSGTLGQKRRAIVAIMISNPIIKFAIVGVLNTVLDMAVFISLMYYATWPLILANSTAYLVATGNSFLLNRFWTFEANGVKGQLAKQLVRFLAVNAAGLALSNLVVGLVALAAPPLVAKAAAAVLVFAWNYWGSQRFAFAIAR